MHPPEATLINWYRPETKSKMGMHVDNDENNFDAPVVSVSLGDPAIFRIGGLKRGWVNIATKVMFRRCYCNGRGVAIMSSCNNEGILWGK